MKHSEYAGITHVRRLAKSIFLISVFFLSISSGHAAAVQSRMEQFTGKQTGKMFTLTPRNDQIMIHFHSNNTQSVLLYENEFIRTFELNTIQSAVNDLQIGVYGLADNMKMESVFPKIISRPEVAGCSPVFMDQEGYTRYFIPDRFTILFNATLSEIDMNRILDEYDCRIFRKQYTYGYFTVSLPASMELFDAVRLFTSFPEVDSAQPEYISFNTSSMVPSDILADNQWHLNNDGTSGGTEDADIDAFEAWDIERGDPDVIIAVIDTGVDWKHEDLAGNIFQNLGEDDDGDGHTMEFVDGEWILDPGDLTGTDSDGNTRVDDLIGWDFANNDNNPMPGSTANDAHGTAVAGLAAALTNNTLEGYADRSYGVAGLAHHCRILPIRHTSSVLSYPENADAINYAASFQSDDLDIIINCSWSVNGDEDVMLTAIQNAWDRDVIICAASGNDEIDDHVSEPVDYPARYAECIAVGGTDCNDLRFTRSSCGRPAAESVMGPELDVSAPGVELRTTDTMGSAGVSVSNYCSGFAGTSGSCPLVAGAAALLKSYDRSLSNEAVRQILRISADKVGGYDYYHDPLHPGHSLELGYGRLNVNRALQMLMVGSGAVADLIPSPSDICFSLDRSSSMTAYKLNLMKNAAAQTVLLMNFGDHLGITQFNALAAPIFPSGGGMLELTDADDKEAAIDAIEDIFAFGRTSIGGGLECAQVQLDTRLDEATSPQNIILMSDGQENEPPWISEVLTDFPANSDVCAIGFGHLSHEYDEEGLQAIAASTGGTYLFGGIGDPVKQNGNDDSFENGLIPAFQTALNKASNRQTIIMETGYTTGYVITPVNIDNTLSDVRLSLLWQDSQAGYQLLLYTPGHCWIDKYDAQSDPSIDYLESNTLASFTIRNPEWGRWYLVAAGNPSEYCVSVSGYCSLKMHSDIVNNGTLLSPLITARLTEMGYPVTGGTVSAQVVSPDLESRTMTLYDDGYHWDGKPCDGVYASVMTGDLDEGTFSAILLASGKTLSKNRDFTRRSSSSFHLVRDETLIPVNISMPGTCAEKNRVILLPVFVETDIFMRDVREYSAIVSFNSAVISPTGQYCIENTLSENCNIYYKQISSSSVKIAGAGSPITGSGILIYLEFFIRGQPGTESALTISGQHLLGNMGEVESITTSGSVRVVKHCLQ